MFLTLIFFLFGWEFPLFCFYPVSILSNSLIRSTCYLYGKLRRTDFLPVGPDLESEVFERGCESMDDDMEEHDEYQWGMQASRHEMEDEFAEFAEVDGNELDDFI